VLAPFMPDTAAELRALLNLNANNLKAPWGEGFAAGHTVQGPKVLFPRINDAIRVQDAAAVSLSEASDTNKNEK
jgi:methionyl-tRNA synthetase